MNQIVRELTAGWKYDAARNVDVIDRADLPFDVVEMAKKQNVPLHEIRGVAYKGHIYLVRHQDAGCYIRARRHSGHDAHCRD